MSSAQTAAPAGPSAVGELKVSDHGARRIGYAALLITFGLFGSWAALAPLDGAALAPGVVVVESYKKTVDHLEGGIVRKLWVRDGDQVEAGAVLVELDDTTARAELEGVHSNLAAFEALEARLMAERDGLPAIDFGEDGGVEADLRVLAARQNEEAIFAARRAARLGETEVLEKRVVQLQEQIRGLEAVIASKGVLIESYQDEITDLSELLAEGYVDRQRLRDQERNLYRLKAEIADHESRVSQAKLEIGETDLQILQLNKDFMREVANDLAEAQTRVHELRERYLAARDRLERTVIRAPESGMVLAMQVHTVGGVVRSATPVLEIVPAGQNLIVEAQISPIDIDRVAVGTPADIRFSAFKSSTTPVIKGTLMHVSADRLINQETGMPYYLGRVELTEQGRRDLGDLQLVPGMPAEVLVTTGERTLLNYLIQPATNAFARSLIED